MKGRRYSQHFNKILVGYDGSAQAEKAVDIALSLAQSVDAKVLVFAVARPPEPATSVELEAVLDDAREHYEQGFRKIRERAEAGLDIQTEIAVGHPAEQIVHKAEIEDIDLIILGRRGVSSFGKWLLGSISERVLRYADCPVMVVK
ncbi:MAG: universal stress protein [Candidatus Korobacteraceae bacterium]|jgi:nucleotide-binding universal stress UspA family protein